MMIKMKGADDGRFGNIADGQAKIETAGGGMHTYSVEETVTYGKMLNHILGKDEDCAKRIPMNTEDDEIFHAFEDGILLCKLLICIDKDCIDRRAINMKD